MAAQLRFGLDGILRRSPLHQISRWRNARRLVVLAYHDIADPDGFRDQIGFLRKTMHPVCLSQAISAMEQRRLLPRGAVLITFDDGDRSVFEAALPILEDGGVAAAAFVVADLVGTDRPFWWNEVEELVRRGAAARGLLPDDPAGAVRALKELPNGRRLDVIAELRRSAGGLPVQDRQLTPGEIVEMASRGVAIGNHTSTHPCLDRCTDDVLRRELERAHESLTEILGRPPVAFAYPNGNYDPRARQTLSELGYRAAFLFDHRVGPFPPPDPYRISRVRVSSTTNPDRFRILVSGLHSSLHHLLRRP